MSSQLPRRILILLHARDRGAERRSYQIWGLAEIWRSWGIEVVVQRGVDRFVDADMVVNHVDLTVVPQPYVLHMARYAVAINGRCSDISKRLVSRDLLRPGDGWDGPVIVKTDRNRAQTRSRPGRTGSPLRRRRLNFAEPPDHFDDVQQQERHRGKQDDLPLALALGRGDLSRGRLVLCGISERLPQ